MKTNAHVVISGRVQGVWYRASAKSKAEQLGIKGWVRNTVDGNVEAVFEGEEEIVEKMIKWCYQGPPLAKVDKIDVKKQKQTDKYNNFSIIH